MNYKITTIIFAISFLITGGLYINQLKINENIELGKNVATYWTCMDGCYNMLEVIYGEIDHNNSTIKAYYDECTINKCEFAILGEGVA